MSIRVASSQENKKMHALESRSTENCMDIEQGQNGQQKRAGASASDDTMVVDVGDSQTNTARPIAAKVVKESQILKEGSSEGEVIEKVRVREVHNEGEQEGICGSTVEGSRVTGWSRPYRKRKASEVEKCITQGEPPRTRRKR